jgi:hypothetical protein
MYPGSQAQQPNSSSAFSDVGLPALSALATNPQVLDFLFSDRASFDPKSGDWTPQPGGFPTPGK